jgi:RecG-like helicase
MPRRRIVDRLTETDEERLAAEIREWADTVPGSVRIADAEERKRVKLAGAVRRITIRPVMGFEGMRLLLFDGTGEVSVVFLGRRSIPGLTLGSRLVVEGVLGRSGGTREIVNPSFEFVPAPD